MNIYVEIGGVRYPATITGKLEDRDWDKRATKSVTLEMTYEEAVKTWTDGVAWSIICEQEITQIVRDEEGNVVADEDGNPLCTTATQTDVADNSDYSISGDITDHRDGTITVKMGKMTDLEVALAAMLA